MDPRRPLLDRGAFFSSSAHAVAAIILVAFLLLTLICLPLSLSTPPSPLADSHEDQEQDCDLSSPLDCADPRLFHLMMRSAIDAFPAVHFARFGRPVPGDPPSASCDMAWRARSNSSTAAASPTATTKDYRRFTISLNPRTCAYSVVSIGDYHSGPNARKPRPGASNATTAAPPPPPLSRAQFAAATYLSYHGGGDRCKSMPHYTRSLLCALAEARYLNRTLVLDPTLCLAAAYTAAGMPEEGKRLAFYVDVDHLRSSTVAGIVEEQRFWEDWDRWGAHGQLRLRLVEDTRVAPTKFSKAKATLIVRKFGDVEPGNYWYRVCEGEAERVLAPPHLAIRLAPSLMSIVDAIISSMQPDFDSVHADTKEDLKWKIEESVDAERHVYLVGEGVNMVLVEALKANHNNLHYLDQFQGLWGNDSKWFLEMKRLNGGVPVEFDGYMRELIDKEVFLKGKKRVQVQL